MDLQEFLNSRQGGELALGISRRINPQFAGLIIKFVAQYIASRRQLPLVRAIRANQWVISGGKLTSSQLDQAVKESLGHAGHSFYTFFHNLDCPDNLQKLIEFSPQADYLIEQSREAKQGVIVAGVHMGNFDLVAHAAALRGLRAVGLSLPQPDEAVEWQHNFRRRMGLEIMPASVVNIRHIIHRLQAGETILTGVDRPMEGLKVHPVFFGRPACVPVHYVSLALKARVPIVLMGAILRDDGKYHILSSDFIEMQSYPNHQAEIQHNAERILEVAAEFIRQAPHQWLIFNPVWPEILADTP